MTVMTKPLSSINKDSSVVVKYCTDVSLKKRLLSLGILPKQIFTIKNRMSNGAVVLGNDAFKIAIDAYSAQQILVKVV